MQSDSIKELATALVAAQGEFSAVPKGSVNPFFKSKYAALPDVVASAGPVLAKHGLGVSQFLSEGDSLTTILMHTSGEFISYATQMHLVKDDPQGAGSAVTYYRRYAYMSCLGLVADDDDDGNAASKPKNQGSKTQMPGEAPRSPSEPSEQKSAPSTPITDLQRQIREHKAYISMASTEKGTFLADTVGHAVTSIKDLTPDDCEQVIAKLRNL